MTQKITALAWEKLPDGCVEIRGFPGGSWFRIPPNYPDKEEMAAFIVKACNSHYELLEALKAALSADGLCTMSMPARRKEVVKKIKAAIAKAGGGQ